MNDWREVTLAEVASEVTVGHVGSMAKHYIEDGIPFLRSLNVNPHCVNLRDVKYISPEFHAKLGKSSLLPGDVVTVRTGKPGTTSVIPEELPIANCSDLVITRPGPDLDAWWFSYYMNSIASNFIESQLVGAVQQHFNVGSAKSMKINLPPLAYQEAVVEVLGALDDKIAANTKLGHTVEAFGSAQFTRLALDVEPTDEGILLDDLFDLNPRRTVASDNPTIIDMKALPTDKPLVEEWAIGARKGGTRFKNGDTLVARITPCLENRKTAFVDFLDDEEVGIGSTEFIVMRSKNDLPLGLSYFMAISERFRDFAIQNLVGTSGRQRVSAADLARHTLSRVAASELQEFGKWADDNLTFLGSLREENRTLAAIRDALLPQLMSGKLRVKDAEKVVEETL